VRNQTYTLFSMTARLGSIFHPTFEGDCRTNWNRTSDSRALGRQGMGGQNRFSGWRVCLYRAAKARGGGSLPLSFVDGDRANVCSQSTKLSSVLLCDIPRVKHIFVSKSQTRSQLRSWHGQCRVNAITGVPRAELAPSFCESSHLHVVGGTRDLFTLFVV
jgi:hypothetical protein